MASGRRLAQLDRALGTLLTDADTQAIDTPALLVVWGESDRILPPPDGVGERVAAGHMLQMEAANDIVRHLR